MGPEENLSGLSTLIMIKTVLSDTIMTHYALHHQSLIQYIGVTFAKEQDLLESSGLLR